MEDMYSGRCGVERHRMDLSLSNWALHAMSGREQAADVTQARSLGLGRSEGRLCDQEVFDCRSVMTILAKQDYILSRSQWSLCIESGFLLPVVRLSLAHSVCTCFHPRG